VVNIKDGLRILRIISLRFWEMKRDCEESSRDSGRTNLSAERSCLSV
jgi:hypothetical protein